MNLRGLKKRRLEKGEPIEFLVKGTKPSVTLVAPKRRPAEVELKGTGRERRVSYHGTEEEGLYVFTITEGKRVSKEWYSVGDIVADWVSTSFATREGGRYIERLIRSFSDFGNVVCITNLADWHGVMYPSNRFPRAEGSKKDPVGAILRASSNCGIAALLAFHWVPKGGVDMWMHPATEQIASAKAMIKELHALYARHPSMAGFYSYWEPGDVLQAPYYVETTGFAKSLDPGLFTGAAPYIFSTERYHGGTLPNMPASLSSIDSLDCIVPQSSIAIYPYPINRTKDHLALTAGSLLGRSSGLAVGHVETFPRYFVKGEKLMPAAVIAGQVLSAAMTRNSSGVSTFIFSYVLDRSDEALDEFGKAMVWYRRLADFRRSENPVASYIPSNPSYWPTLGTKVLAGLRRIGLDTVPVKSPLAPSRYWQKALRKRAAVIILFDPPELLKSEAEAIADLCKSGSSLVVTGYPPSGLREVLGVDSRNVGKYGGYKLTQAIGRRTQAGEVRRFGFEFVFCPTLCGAKSLGVFESIPPGFQPGAFALTRNRFGRGNAYFVGIPAIALLERAPELLLDIVDRELRRKGDRLAWDIVGLSDQCDFLAGSDFLAAVNLGAKDVRVKATYTGLLKARNVRLSCGPAYGTWDPERLVADLTLKPGKPVLINLVS